MSLSDFFSPLTPEKFTPKQGFYRSQMGLKVSLYLQNFPDLSENEYDIAIFGVLDDRAAVNNSG
ncbi:MAG: arginase, partial [Pedobacter sp.]|nr:arginase [Pedobacter sp.]